ncbi:MAG TPA: hypothetical protein VLF91_05740 [Candidatus Saccharimonadales bacterium]|nr:hypothetical protein [Candidatus Saccharimonadales bacterium]
MTSAEGDPKNDNPLLQSKAGKRVAAALLRVALGVAMKTTGRGPLRLAKDPELLSGMTAGTILQNPLYQPDVTDQDAGRVIVSSLIRKEIGGGLWRGYDFNRHVHLPPPLKKTRPYYRTWDGSIYAMLPESIKDNDPDTLTPWQATRVYDPDCVFTFDKPTPDELIGRGCLKLTTYEQAYREVGAFDAFGEELAARRLLDEPVYQVTPKGNTTILLGGRSGEPKLKEDRRPEFALIDKLRPVPAGSGF